MRVLLHTCCAPCSVYCIDTLKSLGLDVTAFWYNPNIHPYTEYKSRLETFRTYMKIIDLDYIEKDEYGLKDFVKNTIDNLDNRCVTYCYKIRMEETVKKAKEQGYDAFTTTLLVSPYQKHEEIKAICEELAEKYDIEFLYNDFRIGFRDGQSKAREIELYMQKYCGCIFSEQERYLKKEVKTV